MATSNDLPAEMISKIAQFLPPQDVLNCMLVCKLWKEVISSEQFFKNYVLYHHDFEDEEKPSGYLADWQNTDECFFYWKENADKSNLYVFSDPPRRWKCGIVHLAKYTLESHKDLKYKDFLQAVLILMRILKAADPEQLYIDCDAFGNEEFGTSDRKVEVCLFPWSKDTLPTAEDIIALFHFNPEMCNHPLVDSELPDDDDYNDGDGDGDDDDDDDDGDDTLRAYHCGENKIEETSTFFTWLQNIFTYFIRLFHYNPEVSNDPREDNKLSDDEDDEEDDDDYVIADHNHETTWNTLSALHHCDQKAEATAFFNWLKTIFKPFIRIAIGYKDLNPVPCFMLARIAPGWVGGMLTSLTLK